MGLLPQQARCRNASRIRSRSSLPGLILQMGRLIELLVVVNAEHSRRGRRSRSGAADLRKEEPRRNSREDHERRKAVYVGTLTRPANPGILDLSHAIGKKMGIRKLGFAGYLEEGTFDNDFISIGSFSISMPRRQCVSESSIVGIDWPASSCGDAQLP